MFGSDLGGLAVSRTVKIEESLGLFVFLYENIFESFSMAQNLLLISLDDGKQLNSFLVSLFRFNPRTKKQNAETE